MVVTFHSYVVPKTKYT